MRGAPQVLRGMFDELSAAKTLNERIGFRIRTQMRKEFFCGVEILSFPLLGPFEFRLAQRRLPSLRIFLEDALKLFLRIEYLGWHPPTGSPEVRVHRRFRRKFPLIRASQAALCSPQTPVSFSGSRFSRDGGSEHGFRGCPLRSPRGLRLCARSDRIS